MELASILILLVALCVIVYAMADMLKVVIEWIWKECKYVIMICFLISYTTCFIPSKLIIHHEFSSGYGDFKIQHEIKDAGWPIRIEVQK